MEIRNNMIAASRGKKIKDASSEEIQKLLRRIMDLLGLVNVPEGIETLEAEIKKEFAKATIQEMEYAYKLGILEKLDREIKRNLSFLTFSETILSYKRLKVSIMDPDPVIVEKEIIGEDKKEQIIKNAAIWAFENFKKEGTLMDAGSVIYNYLNNKKLLNFNEDELKEIERRATDMEMEDRSKLTTQIQRSLKKSNITHHESYKKRVMLQMYFESLINFEINIKDKI